MAEFEAECFGDPSDMSDMADPSDMSDMSDMADPSDMSDASDVTDPVLTGCMDPEACNYDELAVEDDGSCYNEGCKGVYGCTDSAATSSGRPESRTAPTPSRASSARAG